MGLPRRSMPSIRLSCLSMATSQLVVRALRSSVPANPVSVPTTGTISRTCSAAALLGLVGSDSCRIERRFAPLAMKYIKYSHKNTINTSYCYICLLALDVNGNRRLDAFGGGGPLRR